MFGSSLLPFARLVQFWVGLVSKVDKGRGGGRGKGKKASGGSVPPQENDVSCGRNAGPFGRRCGRSHGIWRSWCDAANVLGSFLKCLMIARMLVAGSLFVIGRSSGN